MSTTKQIAKDIINNLSDEASWDDVIYEIVTRREIDLGIEDSDAGRITSVEDVVKEFGIQDS